MGGRMFRSGSEGTWAAGLRGLMEGIKNAMQLKNMAADRAIEKRRMELMEADEVRKGKPKGIYSEETGQWITPPPEYGDVDIIRKQPTYWGINPETPPGALPPGVRPVSIPKPTVPKESKEISDARAWLDSIIMQKEPITESQVAMAKHYSQVIGKPIVVDTTPKTWM